MTAAVLARGLRKTYRGSDVPAVDGIDLDVARGEIFGLLGPNGAGKSTTIGILTTRVRASAGTAVVAGIDVHTQPVLARSRLAVVPQQSNLDRSLTPLQNLTFHAAYHGMRRTERHARATRLLAEFDLTGAAGKKVDHYSGGMAQRLMIARALMHRPEVLFLDEPTTGLDPQARLDVWRRIEDLKERGIGVIITTHDMTEAATLADRVGIVDRGRVLVVGRPAEMVAAVNRPTSLDLTITPAPGDDQAGILAAVLRIRGVDVAATPSPAGQLMRVVLTDRPGAVLPALMAVLAARNATLTNLRLDEPTLEDVFIELTGRGLR